MFDSETGAFVGELQFLFTGPALLQHLAWKSCFYSRLRNVLFARKTRNRNVLVLFMQMPAKTSITRLKHVAISRRASLNAGRFCSASLAVPLEIAFFPLFWWFC